MNKKPMLIAKIKNKRIILLEFGFLRLLKESKIMLTKKESGNIMKKSLIRFLGIAFLGATLALPNSNASLAFAEG